MPHRVANFLRSSSGSIPHIKKKAKSTSSSTSSSGSSSRNASTVASRNNSISTSPYSSDSDEHLQHLQHQHHHNHHHTHAGKMQEHLADALRKHHRLSLPFGRSSSKERQERQERQQQHGGAAKDGGLGLDWSVESPPVVFHGTPAESSGALFSGQMFVDVRDEVVEVDSFVATLSLRLTHKRPYQSHCADCQTQVTELRSWKLLTQPATLRKGRHQFPFSMLLEGRLPASMDSTVLSIAYEFRAEAMVVVPGCASASCLKVKLERPVVVKRSLPDPLYPHHSVRIFPPTNIKASAHYNSVIHPTGNNTLTLKLDGLVTHNKKVKTLDLWKLKKVTWRLEETVKTIAPACRKHEATAIATTTAEEDATEKKGTFRSETRVIGEKVLHEGWKSDFTGNDGTVDMEFDYTALHPPAKPSGSSSGKYACDAKWEDGTEVTHSLLLELIVSKEYAPEGKPQLATQTGTGRILRMHFAVNLTEFPGMGVSWDNEAPPVYQDVPPSPPAYPTDEGRREPPIDYYDLEPLDLELLEAERATPPRRLSDADFELSE